MLGALVWLFMLLGFACFTAAHLVARARLGFVIASLVCFLAALVFHIVVMMGVS